MDNTTVKNDISCQSGNFGAFLAGSNTSTNVTTHDAHIKSF